VPDVPLAKLSDSCIVFAVEAARADLFVQFANERMQALVLEQRSDKRLSRFADPTTSGNSISSSSRKWRRCPQRRT
jgi:hypothetical protein